MTLPMAKWRADGRACAARKLRLAQADLVRRDLTAEHVAERMQEWLDAFLVEPPPPPMPEDSPGARIAKRQAIYGMAGD